MAIDLTPVAAGPPPVSVSPPMAMAPVFAATAETPPLLLSPPIAIEPRPVADA
jgi:hypothetical protein